MPGSVDGTPSCVPPSVLTKPQGRTRFVWRPLRFNVALQRGAEPADPPRGAGPRAGGHAVVARSKERHDSKYYLPNVRGSCSSFRAPLGTACTSRAAAGAIAARSIRTWTAKPPAAAAPPSATAPGSPPARASGPNGAILHARRYRCYREPVEGPLQPLSRADSVPYRPAHESSAAPATRYLVSGPIPARICSTRPAGAIPPRARGARAASWLGHRRPTRGRSPNRGDRRHLLPD